MTSMDVPAGIREFLSSRRNRKTPRTLRPALQQILDAFTDAPAWIRNGRHDVLAMNPLALVGELSTRSELFRQRWASQDVRFHRSGRKRLNHPVVGQLDLDFERCRCRPNPVCS
jgi:hypothetical protein